MIFLHASAWESRHYSKPSNYQYECHTFRKRPSDHSQTYPWWSRIARRFDPRIYRGRRTNFTHKGHSRRPNLRLARQGTTPSRQLCDGLPSNRTRERMKTALDSSVSLLEPTQLPMPTDYSLATEVTTAITFPISTSPYPKLANPSDSNSELLADVECWIWILDLNAQIFQNLLP